MRTECVQAESAAIARAAALLRAGEVVAFPTETVYGLGADATNPEAVRRIFAAKGRPSDNPLIVHVASVAQIAPLVTHMDDRARLLMRTFWPGPLTLVLPKSERVPMEVSAGLHTVGIRLPAHPVAQALIRAAGVPIAAPSANRSGKPSPTTAAHVLEDMDGRIPMVLDGGACDVGVESTVLDITGDVPVVLRPGGITPEMLRAVIGDVCVDDSALKPLDTDQPRSPGMKYKHYAPSARLMIVSGSVPACTARMRGIYDEAEQTGQRPVLLAARQRQAAFGARAFYACGNVDDPAAAAAELFAALRALDAEPYGLIIAEAVDAKGIGLAVMNRLGRAAGFDIIAAQEDA